MSSSDCCSLGSSSAFGTDNSCLPRSRIKCGRNHIVVGDSSFSSASDALVVYLKQFDASVERNNQIRGAVNAGEKLREPTPLDQYLASDRSALSATSLPGDSYLVGERSVNLSDASKDVHSLLVSQMSSSQLREEVTDALREVKLRRLLKHAALKSQSQTQTHLQREVEAALLRSAQLLEKVSKADTSLTSMLAGDVNNVSTKTLGHGSVALEAPEPEQRQSGHRYSYRTSHCQRPVHQHSPSKFLHIPASSSLHQQARSLRRSASIENLSPASHKLPPRSKRSFSSNSTPASYHSDPTDILKRARSRSVSPGLGNPASSVKASAWTGQPNVGKSVPSWVGELTPSEVSDSLWNSKSLLKVYNGRRPYEIPSWVGEAENSQLCVDSNYLCEDSRLAARLSWLPGSSANGRDHSTSAINSDLSGSSAVTADSRPRLRFSDLALSDISCPDDSQHASLISARKRSSSLAKYKPKHSTPNHTNHIMTHADSLSHTQHSRMLDSDYTGETYLHKNILPQTAKLKKSMDKFVASSENLRHRSLSPELSVASGSAQCSSLDTMTLLAGKPLLPTETPVAGPALGDNRTDRSTSPTSSGQEQCSSDGLDGDRPWEKMAVTFKPPVPVDSQDTPDVNDKSLDKSTERTLSGRKQPGSMETLKNMLFKLQAEESFTQEGSSKNEDDSYSSHKINSQTCVDFLPALQNYDFVKEPGGQSLEKALVHLNRLKQLVERPATPASSE